MNTECRSHGERCYRRNSWLVAKCDQGGAVVFSALKRAYAARERASPSIGRCSFFSTPLPSGTRWGRHLTLEISRPPSSGPTDALPENLKPRLPCSSNGVNRNGAVQQ